jgi:predicted DNA-binding protein (MmcQ/YjbR family)
MLGTINGTINGTIIEKSSVMNIESVREYCLSLPMTSEDTAFGDDCLLLRVCDKIYVCLSFEREENLTLKCNPDYAIELRDRYSDIEPAWHWNKKYWNQLRLQSGLSDDLVKGLIRHSYSEVVKKLTRKVKIEHPEILEIKQ